MTFDELKSARESYAYIPARLIRVTDDTLAKLTWRTLKLGMAVPNDWQKGGALVRRKFSSFELDLFHQTLLSDEHDESLMHGLLSVVFWGFASGTNGHVNPERALARSRMILNGHKTSSPQNVNEIVGHLKSARTLLQESRISAALHEAQRIKFLGMAFASKVVTFMNPIIAAVYDDVICERLKKERDLDLKRLYVSTKLTISEAGRLKQSNIYENWCHWCFNKADALNTSAIRWKDWNGVDQLWRAVDVERAFYALPDKSLND